MERLFKENGLKYGPYLLAFLAGFLVAKGPSFFHNDNPTFVSFKGGSLQLKDVEKGMTPQEINGNSLEYQKQAARNLIWNQTVADLAKKDGLSVPDFMNKVKSGADTSVSDGELAQFLRERNFDKKKLTQAQMNNILANLKEHKRDVYFNGYMNKVLASMNVNWKE